MIRKDVLDVLGQKAYDNFIFCTKIESHRDYMAQASLTPDLPRKMNIPKHHNRGLEVIFRVPSVE
jgi:hypothetical protein